MCVVTSKVLLHTQLSTRSHCPTLPYQLTSKPVTPLGSQARHSIRQILCPAAVQISAVQREKAGRRELQASKWCWLTATGMCTINVEQRQAVPLAGTSLQP